MKNPGEHTIYTIGHSTHTFDEFMNMLQSFNIEVVADIRSLPGSRKFPQFNKENLETSLENNGIKYLHLSDLGGRRKVKKDSKNNRWRHKAFKGYADYMETREFEAATENLEQIAMKQTIAIMCSEAVWWRCHRSMVSDYLKAKGWKVLHIMSKGKIQEHPYTAPAIVRNGHVSYSDTELFD